LELRLDVMLTAVEFGKPELLVPIDEEDAVDEE
jgi:hypothetical protein